MAAGSIVVDLLMRTGSFETDTERARKSLERFKKEAVETAKQLGTIIGGAAVVAGGALVAMTKQAIDGADALNDLAERTGIAVEKLSALQYAAEVGDVSAQDLASGLAKLARQMSEAANGAQGPAEAFNALGVAVKNADGSLRGTDQVLADLATRFASYADGAEKTALAQEIFGKSGATLIPLLNQGAAGMERLADEAQRLGIVVDTETAVAAGEFNDALMRLLKGADAVGLRMAKELLPTLQAVTDEFVRARTEGGPLGDLLDFMAGTIRTTAEALVILGANVSFVLTSIGRELGAIGAQAAALARLDLSGFRAISEAVREDGRRARAELDALERRILGFSLLPQADYSNEGRNYARNPAAAAAPRLRALGGGAARAAAERGFSGLTPEQEIAQSVGRAIEDSDIIKAQRLAQQIEFLDKLFFEAGLDARIYESAMRKLTGATDSGKDATSDFLAEQERLARLLAGTASAQLEEQRADMLLLAKAFEDGRISVSQYYEAVAARLGTAQQETERTKSLAEDLGLTFASAFEDAIVHGNDLRSVINGLASDILRITTRKLVTEPLGQMFADLFKTGGSGGSGGGFLSSIGNFIGGLFGGGRASGGTVDPGRLYRVNERGAPEMLEVDGREFLLMGNRRGWVDPSPQGRSSAGGMWAPVFHMNFAPGTTAETANQAGAAVARRLRVSALRNG